MQSPASPKTAIGVILAGGEGRRLGGIAKAAVSLHGVTLLERVRAQLAPQVKSLLLSIAPRFMNAAWVDASGLPSVLDPFPDAGPLGGIAGALVWARAYAPEAAAIVSVPVDVPFVPSDLVTRLLREDGLAVAQSGEQMHHAIAAWPLAVADDLLTAVGRGERAIHRWQARHPVRVVTWPTEPFDPFLNINTPEDVRAAEDVAAQIAAQSPRSVA
jgi:molybdopterin-guanine dinucleotide biosynthesis protein A